MNCEPLHQHAGGWRVLYIREAQKWSAECGRDASLCDSCICCPASEGGCHTSFSQSAVSRPFASTVGSQLKVWASQLKATISKRTVWNPRTVKYSLTRGGHMRFICAFQNCPKANCLWYVSLAWAQCCRTRRNRVQQSSLQNACWPMAPWKLKDSEAIGTIGWDGWDQLHLRVHDEHFYPATVWAYTEIDHLPVMSPSNSNLVCITRLSYQSLELTSEVEKIWRLHSQHPSVREFFETNTWLLQLMKLIDLHWGFANEVKTGCMFITLSGT